MEKKIGRNDLCWCGSGQKYKNCHMTLDKKIFSYALERPYSSEKRYAEDTGANSRNQGKRQD